MKRYVLMMTFVLVMAGLLYLLSVKLAEPDRQEGVFVKMGCEAL